MKNIKEAFAPQLAQHTPLGHAFFNPPVEKPTGERTILGPWTDEEWAAYRERMRSHGRTTYFGTKMVPGDVILWAIVYEPDSKKEINHRVATFVARELDRLEKDWGVLPFYNRSSRAPQIIPTIIKLEDGDLPHWFLSPPSLPVTD